MSKAKLTAARDVEIKHNDPRLTEAQDCIAELLGFIDHYAGTGMHRQGQTPDWYVRAAAISCGLDPTTRNPDTRGQSNGI